MQRLDQFATRVSAARQRKGMSRRELALAVEISPTYMALIEDGQAAPNEDVVARLCRELDLDFDSIMIKHGRLPSDVQKFIVKNPTVFAQLRRRMRRSSQSAA